MIRNPGGLWDASAKIYPYVGAKPKPSSLRWNFPAGGYAVMRHLKDDSTVNHWQGSELIYVAFDELTHFTSRQFWGIVSRLRSTSGIRPYLRATCNPVPPDDKVGGWVHGLISWWLQEDGFPDRSRAGVLRYFERHGDELVWFDHPTSDTKSLTFIPSRVTDNPALLTSDPAYLATLKSLPLIERSRLLDGNWLIRAEAGKVFRHEWFKLVPSLPQVVATVRAWDFASTSDRKGADPDATASVKLGLLQNGGVVVIDVTVEHLTPAGVDTHFRAVAAADGTQTRQRWQRDPGQAGEYQNQALRSLLRGYDAKGISSTLSKLERAGPLSRAAEFGELYVLAGPWANRFISELTAFPDGAHDDQVDAAALAYLDLTGVAVPRFGQASFR